MLQRHAPCCCIITLRYAFLQSYLGVGYSHLHNTHTVYLAYNATSRPSVAVLSNQEVFVTWKKPLRLSGQLIRYELIVNGKVMYSGIDTKYTMKTLNADETYEFMVSFTRSEF